MKLLCTFVTYNFAKVGVSNQITVVAFQPVQLAQASFLQKNQMLQNIFLIFVTQRWHKASVACKNQSFKVDYFDFSCENIE